MNAHRVVDGMFWFLAFLFSTTVHEAAHAYVAMRGGDRTAYSGGQVSLSPWPHIRREPIGMLLVPLFTAMTMGWAMGWASAPFDPRWAERHPRRAAWMAAAGPLSNFALALLSFGALRLGLAVGWFEVPGSVNLGHLVVPAANAPAFAAAFFAQALSVMLMLNVLLGTFNLLPLPPLDGASAAELILPSSIAGTFRSWIRAPQFSFIGMLIAWRVFPYLAAPLFHAVVFALFGSY